MIKTNSQDRRYGCESFANYKITFFDIGILASLLFQQKINNDVDLIRSSKVMKIELIYCFAYWLVNFLNIEASN